MAANGQPMVDGLPGRWRHGQVCQLADGEPFQLPFVGCQPCFRTLFQLGKKEVVLPNLALGVAQDDVPKRQTVQLIFGGSGIVPAAMVAILLNILLPKEKAEEKV